MRTALLALPLTRTDYSKGNNMPHRKVGPDQPEVRDGYTPEVVVPFGPEECAKVVRDDSSAPALRRPGATIPKNGNANALPGRGD